MKKTIQTLLLSEYAKRAVIYVIYAIFAKYTLQNLLLEPSIIGKVSYGMLLFIFLGIAGWAEYLRILYHRMIRSLNWECDPKKAQLYYHKLKKRDIFKSYQRALLIFDLLYYQDLNQPYTCIQILEKNQKVFRSSLDYLFIRNFTYFYSYYQLNNRTKMKKYYPEVMKMKGIKIKGHKVSPLYNWEFIEGLYLFCLKDYKKSIRAFQNVNTQNMNNRELSQYYLAFGKAYRELQDKEHADIMFSKIIKIGNKLAYCVEAKTYIKS